jgi:dihydropteroate synthase
VTLRLRDRVVSLQKGEPLVMGIVNASPESFSDGDTVGGLEAQVERALSLIEDGADLIDVGGESGVTDREPVSPDEEAARVVPLIERLAGAGVSVSVDTWKTPVARAAIEAGAVMVNDVSGLSELGVADACASSGTALVLMHTRAAPKVKAFPDYDDVGADVVEFLRSRMGTAAERGVGEEQIVLDPGPDFAKRPAETVEVLRRLGSVVELGRPVLLAASRKDFVGALTGRAPGGRLAGTLAAIGEGVDAGAAILRVHDVAATRDFLTVRAALRGDREVPPDLALDPALRREGVRVRVR